LGGLCFLVNAASFLVLLSVPLRDGVHGGEKLCDVHTGLGHKRREAQQCGEVEERGRSRGMPYGNIWKDRKERSRDGRSRGIMYEIQLG